MVSTNFNEQQAQTVSGNKNKEQQPLVSVIIPVRNRAKQLEAALLSVLSQREGIAELIVIDGGSTDGTLDILRRHSDAIHYWVSEPDRGIYDAMNKGIKQANGKYLYFLGSDDILTVDLRILASVLTDPLTIYYGSVRTPKSNGADGPFNVWKLAVSTINHQSIFYPITAFEDDSYCVDYKILADWAFNLRCFGNKRLRFQYIPYEIAYYSLTGVSSQVEDEAFLRDRLRLIRENLPIYVYWYASVRTRLKGPLKWLLRSPTRGVARSQQ
jgi:glycosyltransferase involved in cell wall biosynthesis